MTIFYQKKKHVQELLKCFGHKILGRSLIDMHRFLKENDPNEYFGE